MIRVLHSVSNMDRAGIETILMNYYRHINRDKIQFDFLCNKTKPGAYDEEIISMGGRIFHTQGLNPIKYSKYLKFMKLLFEKHREYRIIEAHNGALAVYSLHAAKLSNIPIRIFHAHGASITKDWKWPIKILCKLGLKANINQKFTCGVAAAECYFGKNVVSRNDYVFIPNAIEVEKFIFSLSTRVRLRNEFCLQGKHVIGHVGRFMSQKNHKFIIKLFNAIAEKDPESVLVLLGDGELLKEVKSSVTNLKLENRVLFLGSVSNANEWYSVFDVFILPSIWEGLPVVGIEAQAADLPCVFSSNVTREIGLSRNVTFLSLDAKIDLWVDKIINCFDDTARKDRTELITEAHYNISVEAGKLEKRYLDLYKESQI